MNSSFITVHNKTAGLLYQLVHVLLYAAVHAIQAQLHIAQGTVLPKAVK